MLDLTKPLRLKQSKEPVVLQYVLPAERDQYGDTYNPMQFADLKGLKVYCCGSHELEQFVENAPPSPDPLLTTHLKFSVGVFRPYVVHVSPCRRDVDYGTARAPARVLAPAEVKALHEWLGRVMEATPCST